MTDFGPAGEFDVRGQALWDSLSGGLDAVGLELLREACRLADRLDALHRFVRDPEAWLEGRVEDNGMRVRIAIDAPLAEARQTASTFRQVLGAVRDKSVVIPPYRNGLSGESQPAEPGEEVDPLDELALRRAADGLPVTPDSGGSGNGGTHRRPRRGGARETGGSGA